MLHKIFSWNFSKTSYNKIERNNMILKINDFSMDYEQSKNNVIMDIFTFLLVHAQYQSLETLKENLLSSCEFLIEGISNEIDFINMKNKTRRSYYLLQRRRISKFQKLIDNFETKNQIIRAMYDMFMTIESMPLLPGFGMTNKFGDWIGQNPERRLLRDTPDAFFTKGGIYDNCQNTN